MGVFSELTIACPNSDHNGPSLSDLPKLVGTLYLKHPLRPYLNHRAQCRHVRFQVAQGSSSGAILGDVISPAGVKSLREIVDSFLLSVGLTHNGDSLHLAPPRLLVDCIYLCL